MRELIKIVAIVLAYIALTTPLKSTPIKSTDSLLNLARSNRDSMKLILSKYYYEMALRDPYLTDSASINIQYMIGENLLLLRKYDQALDMLIKVATIADSIKDYHMLVKIYNLSAKIYQERSRFEKSLVYINLAERYIVNIHDSHLLFDFYSTKRKFFSYAGNPDSAFYFAAKAVEISKQLGPKEATVAMQNFALQLADIGEIDSFERINDSILTVATKKRDFETVGLSYFYFDLICLRNKKYRMAVDYTLKSIPYLQDYQANNFICEAYKIITDSKLNLGDYADAYHFQKKYYDLRDSVFSNEATNRMNEITIIYDVEKTKNDNKLNNLTIKKQKDVQTGLVIIIALSVLLLAMIIQRYFANLNLNNKLKELNEKLENESLKLSEANRLLKNSREELQEANDAKDKFFSLIAHDLKNPLTGIKSSANLLQEYYDKLSEDRKRKHINTINESVDRLYKMLENLLDWSRIQTKRITLNAQQADISMLIDDCISIFQNQAAEKNILIVNSSERGLICHIDVEMIKVALRNLLSNALKFSNDNSTILVESFLEGNSVMINVKDQGIGIPEYHLADIFKLKFNTSRNGTHNEKGSGLGLVLTKEFVEMNGGKISVASQPGKGSTFLIKLPLHA